MQSSKYGPKQALQAWSSQLRNQLIGLGFHGTHLDSSLFLSTNQVCHHIYPHDILITSFSEATITKLLSNLAAYFTIKTPNQLNFVLRIEAISLSQGILILPIHLTKD